MIQMSPMSWMLTFLMNSLMILFMSIKMDKKFFKKKNYFKLEKIIMW